jgi:hypothetical protein
MLLRARAAILLDRLSFWLAPELSYADRERLVSRISRYTEHQARPRRLRVRRPDGLSTTHGRREPWHD